MEQIKKKDYKLTLFQVWKRNKKDIEVGDWNFISALVYMGVLEFYHVGDYDVFFRPVSNELDGKCNFSPFWIDSSCYMGDDGWKGKEELSEKPYVDKHKIVFGWFYKRKSFFTRNGFVDRIIEVCTREKFRVNEDGEKFLLDSFHEIQKVNKEVDRLRFDLTTKYSGRKKTHSYTEPSGKNIWSSEMEKIYYNRHEPRNYYKGKN